MEFASVNGLKSTPKILIMTNRDISREFLHLTGREPLPTYLSLWLNSKSKPKPKQCAILIRAINRCKEKGMILPDRYKKCLETAKITVKETLDFYKEVA